RIMSRLACFVSHDASSTVLYTISLHDALPIYRVNCWRILRSFMRCYKLPLDSRAWRRNAPQLWCSSIRKIFNPTNHWEPMDDRRSEEHTSELQSRENLVCRLLLEKKKYIMMLE